mmetsp:Transcript_16265/g.48732  ORF Transcript_16265/g.48732 Transcript_16265/m.48732 type:complete len:291 (+) Transcript_16265:1958-2830(+)
MPALCIQSTTCWARDHWPSVPKAVTRAVQLTTSGLMPQRLRISSKRAAPRRHSPPAAQAEMTAAKACPVGRQAAFAISSHMSRARCQQPPSAAARIAAVYACTEGAMRDPGGAARMLSYVRMARCVSPARAQTSISVVAMRQSGSHPSATASAHTWKARDSRFPASAARMAAVYVKTVGVRDPPPEARVARIQSYSPSAARACPCWLHTRIRVVASRASGACPQAMSHWWSMRARRQVALERPRPATSLSSSLLSKGGTCRPGPQGGSSTAAAGSSSRYRAGGSPWCESA